MTRNHNKDSMPSPRDYYLPPNLNADDYSICSDTDSMVSDPGGQFGPGRSTALVLARLGHELDSLLSSAAERLGYGHNAMMQTLLKSIRSGRRRHGLGRNWRRPRQEDITAAFLAQTLPPPSSTYIEQVCRKLVRSIR